MQWLVGEPLLPERAVRIPFSSFHCGPNHAFAPLPAPPPTTPSLSGQDPDQDRRSIAFGLIWGHCDTNQKDSKCHLSEMIVHTHRASTIYVQYVKEIIFSKGKVLYCFKYEKVWILGVKNKIVLLKTLRIYNQQNRLLILNCVCSMQYVKKRTFAGLFHRTVCISFASTGANTNFMDRTRFWSDSAV